MINKIKNNKNYNKIYNINNKKQIYTDKMKFIFQLNIILIIMKKNLKL